MMKQFKRVIGAVLAFALLATVLAPGFAMKAWADETVQAAEDKTAGTVVTGETGFNLVKNPGFENSDSELSDWGSSNASVNTDAAYTHSGAHSVKVAAAERTGEGYAYYVSNTDSIDYDLNGVLKVGMWVYLTNAEDASKVNIHIERPESGGNMSISPEAKTGWQRVMLTTSEVTGCVRNAIKFTVAPGTAGDVYFDDAFIIPADQEAIEMLYNNGFEKGDGWGGTTAYVTDTVRSGAYAMQLSAGADILQSLNWHWYKSELNTGRTLRYSFWVKGGSEDGSISLNAEVKYGDGQVTNAASAAITGNAADWTQVSVDAPAPDGAVSEIVLHVITEGTGDYYVDDGSLRMTPDTSSEDKTAGIVDTGISGINLVDNAGFENSTAELSVWGYNAVSINTDTAYTHSGAVSVKAATGQTGEAYAYSIPSAVYNRNAALTAGMWVYLTDADDASHVTLFMERNSEGGTVTAKPEAKAGWQRVELQAGETSGADHHAIKFVVSAGNTGDIYFDDAYVYCADAESINLIRNGGFESNKDAWADTTGFDIVSDTYRSGAAGAKLTGELNIYQASGWWPNKSSVDSGDTLYYSAWVKGGESAGTITLRAEVKYTETENYYSATVSGATEDWKLLTVAIPYPNAAVNEMLFHISTTGEGVFYVDDVAVNAVKLTLESTEDRTAGSVVTGITGINLMDNAGFENSTAELSNWGYNEAVSVNSNKAYTHSGAVSAKVAAGHAGAAYAYCNTSATYDLNGAFTAGMWVYLAEAEDASYVTLYLERPDSEGGTVTAKPEAKAGWQKVSMGGAATVGTARQAIKFEVQEGNAGDIYFDDAFVYCADAESINLIRNGGFDSDKNTWADTAGFEIAADVNRSGTGSAKLTGALNVYQASGWWPNKTSVDSGDTLYYSAWVKGGENAGAITLRAEVKCGETKSYYSESVSGTADDWQLLTVEIPYPDVTVTEILFHITTTGEGVFYVDDVTVNAVEIPKAVLNSQSIALGDDLDMRFYVSVQAEAVENTAVSITVAGNTVTYPATQAAIDEETGERVFTVSLAAAQMTETVTVELSVDETVIQTGTYSVRQYADDLLVRTTDEKLIALIHAMLDYGAKAQTYFAYNTNVLANEGITVTDQAVPAADSYGSNVENSLDGIRFLGASLLFKSKTVIRYYFVARQGYVMSDYTVTVNGTAYEVQQNSNGYYVDVTVQSPAMLDDVYTVTVTGEENQTLTVSYSGLHYIARMYNKASSSKEMKALLQAMYNYHVAAQA